MGLYDHDESKWSVIPPSRVGGDCWSRTLDRNEWKQYIDRRGCILVVVQYGVSAQDLKTGASIGLWNRRTQQGTIYHDIRNDGFESLLNNDLNFTEKG